MRRTYTFDEVALVPQYNNIPSRTEPSLRTWLTRDIEMSMPLVPANMDTVLGEELAEVLLEVGAIPIFHRFTDLDAQRRWVKRYAGKTLVSAGMHQTNQINELLELGALGVCIDVAHGHSEQMLKFIETLKRDHPIRASTAQKFEQIVPLRLILRLHELDQQFFKRGSPLGASPSVNEDSVDEAQQSQYQPEPDNKSGQAEYEENGDTHLGQLDGYRNLVSSTAGHVPFAGKPPQQ